VAKSNVEIVNEKIKNFVPNGIDPYTVRWDEKLGAMAPEFLLMERNYAEIMDYLEIAPTADNKETPKRVMKALREMTESVVLSPELELKEICTTFENRNKGVVVEQDDMNFSSMCSHHHLPFFGKVKVSYMPRERIIGLSKFQRVVNFFAKKPQVQEDFTEEVANFLIDILDPQTLSIEVYDCVHTCMCARGVRSGAKTTTKFSYVRQPKVEVEIDGREAMLPLKRRKKYEDEVEETLR
jgi:GTP cyclohydrolase IA